MMYKMLVQLLISATICIACYYVQNKEIPSTQDEDNYTTIDLRQIKMSGIKGYCQSNLFVFV